MNFSEFTVTTQEVPGELSLCFTITGCPLRCEGCHSPYLWKSESGRVLTEDLLTQILLKYQQLATCVLFMGGEWQYSELIPLLSKARKLGYKTCLYTGLEQVKSEILKQLTWIKYGPWIAEKGGLDSPATNQRFIKVSTNELLNHLFIKNQE